MWNGAISTLRKSLTENDVTFEADNDEFDLEEPGIIDGVLSVRLGDTWYSWNVTKQDYLDFKDAGFSRSWINDNLWINYKGDWGWPWGRTKQTGWASEH
jgi:hypothetical protein